MSFCMMARQRDARCAKARAAMDGRAVPELDNVVAMAMVAYHDVLNL